MQNHLFGCREVLQFEIGPKDPASVWMRRVDIHALNLHVTERDNHVYVPNFIFNLDDTLASFKKKARFEQRPDVFGELGPKDIHLLFTDDSDDSGEDSIPPGLSALYAFLEFGDITLDVSSYLIPVQGRLYLTCEIRGPHGPVERDIRVAEVSIETLSQTMAATLALVADEYDGDKSFLS
ncbi:hypothetical protein LJR260_000244 [Variovorax paradoxus]|uniref:hypothetical protein n=1 Tax=Variovorax paradoxus TaxID=34073 RepID=UPI003ED0C527